ncbi:16S rRNA (cytidine(1402)-2'-O)-methyltransferase [Candidatus Ornithobacterium hominis]|uniref:16S rRNA (cytidine(1402)-2'-O)-methyltransferase n=1 Tax=Candidatus Ornithobacterium hominis TaxID=2497989 RepID=UPI0024BC23E8|nr:16S rRNA (cytidine(1402)-2'-O)-methyltransferase [Candidatus Ornithobacterium hominis]CAI9428699.1 16S rRNA (cytidine(1402)-2'-O)-methyltransferase [Candidatus Ornithobacterium hominis]
MGKLFLVPTPIGNLADMTFRGVEVLKSVDFILAEDTRNSAKLLQHYEVSTPMYAHHAHNEHQHTPEIIKQLKEGKSFALITDAGTPGISDPGFLLLRNCIENEIETEVLPGATAFVPALIQSALPNHDFYFCGFLPVKKGRQTRLNQLRELKSTLIFYESPHKIEKTLGDFVEHFGRERQACLSREISKKFEEHLRGTLGELLGIVKNTKLKGEMVLSVEGVK